MWIWAAMIDLKAHVLHGKSFHVLDRGWSSILAWVLGFVAVDQRRRASTGTAAFASAIVREKHRW